MKSLGVLLLILFAVALCMKAFTTTRFDGELPLPKEKWASVCLGSNNPGAPDGGVIAELTDPDKVAAVVNFIQTHRTGWTNDRPETLASAAPDHYLSLETDKRNATFYLFLWGNGMKASFYQHRETSYYRDFSATEKVELLKLFGERWSENHRVEPLQ